MSNPQVQLEKCHLAKPEALKLLNKYRKERYDAFQNQEALGDKMKLAEAMVKSQTDELKQKAKELKRENKELRKTVKKLRTDLGLELDPKFKGKMTMDIMIELQEKEQQRDCLAEENDTLKQKIDQLMTELASKVKAKKMLEEQLLSTQSELRHMTRSHCHLLKLCEELKNSKERPLLTTNFPPISRKDNHRYVSDKLVQTVTSIPVCYRSYKKSL
ncbi:hypothetical protein HHUSO_G12453 [Huso huso]|uniref:Uncharacterized protein n=1 Tax=Huso huso TaxID=61971 RepID=A0ABR0ZIP9_HUSHU